MIPIKTPNEIAKMRRACVVAAEILDKMSSFAEQGVSTYDLDCYGSGLMREYSARSAALHYPGITPYPAHSCISLNDEVVHGIPSKKRILTDGDIVSIDVAVFVDGYVGDNTRTFTIGQVSPEIKNLIKITEEALFSGISQALEGNRVGDISHAIEKCATKYNYGILKEFVGHGVGKNMHEEPQIPNYGKPHVGPILKAGMTLAIEPMFTMGSGEVFVGDDGWTVKTKDGAMSAHCEHTILITDSVPEILTLAKK